MCFRFIYYFQIGTKTTKECLHFYYLWKKVCPDEHKRLRIIRRKREHDRLYNLRSQQAAAQVQNTPSAAENHSFSKQEENDQGDSDSESSEFMEIDNQTVREFFKIINHMYFCFFGDMPVLLRYFLGHLSLLR